MLLRKVPNKLERRLFFCYVQQLSQIRGAVVMPIVEQNAFGGQHLVAEIFQDVAVVKRKEEPPIHIHWMSATTTKKNE